MSSDYKPLFPLRLLLLPGDYHQLYIFEERYKQLIADALASGEGFGIPFTSQVNFGNYGCWVEVSDVVKRYAGGEMDIVIQCRGVFKLEKFEMQSEERLYPVGKLKFLRQFDHLQASDALLSRFRQHLVDKGVLQHQLMQQEHVGIFEIANELYLNELEKMELLKCESEAEMDVYLQNYMHYLQLLIDQERSVYQNIYLN